jgi:hypothetical protein
MKQTNNTLPKILAATTILGMCTLMWIYPEESFVTVCVLIGLGIVVGKKQ